MYHISTLAEETRAKFYINGKEIPWRDHFTT